MTENTLHSLTRSRWQLALLTILLALPIHGMRAATLDTVSLYQAIDLRLPFSEAGIANVWDDVTFDGILISPSGWTIPIGGFHHSKDLWDARFAPNEMGRWTYTATLSVLGIQKTSVTDSFYVSNSTERGFIRQDPNNPKRWIYSRDGGLYAGLGFGDCFGSKIGLTDGSAGMDGGYRPKGYHAGIEWTVPYLQYLTAYGNVAGFNLFRFSDGNCSYSNIKTMSASGNDYDTLHSLWTDTLFDSLRAHGFRIYMTIFGSPRGASNDANAMAATERYVQYCIDRYGALVDFWELTNESNPDSLWVSEVATYLHQHDPYHHLVSMSNQMPSHPAIDIISPHWYGKEATNNSDVATEQNIDQYSSITKPVIFGEQGDGSAWDSLSDMRMRGRIWSALFNEGTIIFWNGSFARDCCNQYLGSVERRYSRSLRNFADALDSGVRREPMVTQNGVNIWTLRSPKRLALYLRNDGGLYDSPHGEEIFDSLRGLQIQVTIPASNLTSVGIWYDPSTGRIVSKVPIQGGAQSVLVPAFRTDIAFIAGSDAANLQENLLFDLEVNPLTLDLTGTPENTIRRAPVLLTNSGKVPITVSQILVDNSTKPDFRSIHPTRRHLPFRRACPRRSPSSIPLPTRAHAPR